MESDAAQASHPAGRAPSAEQLQQFISSVDIPPCPAIVTRALAEVRKDEPSLVTLADLLIADPGMSAVVLKFANSVIYRSGSPTSSVFRAVERLGCNTIARIVMAEALRSTFGGLPAAWLEKFWLRIRQLALGSAAVVHRHVGISADAAYTYALFHDAAIPIMMKRFPDYEAVVEAAKGEGVKRIDAENAHFPCSHPVVGALLVRSWGLPANFDRAIRFHHEPDVYELPDPILPPDALSFIAITHIAEYLAGDAMTACNPEADGDLFERALHYLRIFPHEVDELRQRVVLAVESV